MRLLLDTHVLLWALIEPKRLSAEFQALLENPDHEVLFSAASIWEMSIKAALGRADFQVAPATIVEAAQATGFIELPVRAAAALKVAALPHHHRDPFDRLLSRIRPAGQRMGNQNSYRRRDPVPLSVGQPGNLCLVAQAMTEPAAFYTADAQLCAYSELVVRV